MKKLLPFILLAVGSAAHAQHEADRWYFGTMAGLDFSSGSPVVVSSNFSTAEGCATISSPSGQLLFYTDGVTVYDSTHTQMTNGTGLMGDVSSTQSALVVPNPGSNSQYYIFTTAADGGPNGFNYSIVDMTLGTHGDVMSASKNVHLADSTTEKVAAVKDGSDGYWIVAHKWGSDAFLSFHLTTMGLQMTPVVSHSGMVHSTSMIQNTYGQLKFNMCGDRLVEAIGYQDAIELFDFDKATGAVSNALTLNMPGHVYGVELSPNSQFLYASCYDVSAKFAQYDLSQSTPALILASVIPLSNWDDMYGVQMGPDGKIYVSRSFGTSFLGVVNDPDSANVACNYNDNGVDLDPGFMGVNAGLTLPGFMQSYLKVATGTVCPVTTGINEAAANDGLLIYPNPSASMFTIDLSKGAAGQVIIYDYTGKLIEAHNEVSGVFTFGKEYVKGVYLVNVRRGNEMKNYKVVKM